MRVRLSDFIETHASVILGEWDRFAASVEHTGKALDAKALRDHAAEILREISADLARPQSASQQDAKGKGRAVRSVVLTAAEIHADERMNAGFAIDAMITEYRALRASVLKIWAAAGGGMAIEDMRDLTRFNEAVDQAIAESVSRYTLRAPEGAMTKEELTQAWLRAERAGVDADLALARMGQAASDPRVPALIVEAKACRAEAERLFRMLLTMLRSDGENSSPARGGSTMSA